MKPAVVATLPPLRERGEDLSLLAWEFLQRFAIQARKSNLTFSPEALRALNCRSWPRNIRELQNRVKRAVIMIDGKRLTEKDLELGDVVRGSSTSTLKQARESVEGELIQNILKKHLDRISSVAAELGISRPTLYERIEKLGIKKAGAFVQSSSTQR